MRKKIICIYRGHEIMLLDEIFLFERQKRIKNGLLITSLEDFIKNSQITEAPIGLGVSHQPFPKDELNSYMGRIKDKSKEKTDKYKKPYIHGSNIKIKDQSGEDYDIDNLRKLVTTRPNEILKQNEKMQHSDGSLSVYYNVGLPALRGLAVDEDTGQFVIVNTCPGAGKCKLYCYAMKGGYIQYPDSSMFQTRVLNFLLNDPEGFEAKLSSEISEQKKKESKKGNKIVVRWHDSGDFFSPEYLELAFRVARKFPDIDFYAYTKIASHAKGERPDNFLMNFSQGAQSKEERQIDFSKDKHSKVVPKDMFFDLIARDGRKLVKDAKGRTQFIGPNELKTFKKRLSDKYAIDINSILTYDEMVSRNLGKVPKWNIIVMPGDGDDSANNPGVLGTYLLFH